MTTPPAFARSYPNLALARLGCEVVAASDDFFADKSRIILDAPPVFLPNKYDANGKWMDGWETRRRRGGGNDWCVIKLPRAADIVGVDIDTAHFTGNYPLAASLEFCGQEAKTAKAIKEWTPLLPQTPLQGDSHHYLPAETPKQTPARWLRLSIFPDGGIARLRVYGRARPAAGKGKDMAALLNGGRVVAVSDSHFGAPENMLMPGRGKNMGDGWETRRRRTPGSDWALIALGGRGKVCRVELETTHFKGNYPAAFSLNSACAPDLNDSAAIAASMFWQELLPQKPLTANAKHAIAIPKAREATHIRLNIYPDGGVSRFRVFVA